MGDARFTTNSNTTESAIRQLFSLAVMAEVRTPDFDDAWIAPTAPNWKRTVKRLERHQVHLLPAWKWK